MMILADISRMSDFSFIMGLTTSLSECYFVW